MVRNGNQSQTNGPVNSYAHPEENYVALHKSQQN